MCHVIFGAKGITDHMAPVEAVEKINNLLISTTENGVQDHSSLLAFYKLFDKHITKMNTPRRCGSFGWPFISIRFRYFDVFERQRN